MDPKLMAILQKSAAIDKAAKKFDTIPDKGNLGGRGTKGLYDQMGNQGGGIPSGAHHMNESFTPTDPMGAGADGYGEAVDNSGLPPEIKAAMKMNPIQQPDTPTSDFSEEAIRSIRGINETEQVHYDTQDEDDFDDRPVKLTRRPKREVIREDYEYSEPQVSPELIKKLVNEEIKKILPKVLPKVVEHYLQQGLMKENLDILRKIKPSKKR
jgi:hypothetical protein